jgi:glucose/arabinose dehydrogenase
MTTSILLSTLRARPNVERLEPRDCPASVLDPNLAVRDVVTGLNQPTGFAFLGRNDILITEKSTGQVKRFTDGAANGVALDLAVNSASERGLLGIELHPKFHRNGYVYLYWTESTTGADAAVLSQTPTLGNRVDRYRWDGSALVPDKTIIRLRAIQNDPTNGVERGNHDGGKVKFGHDGKLYVMIGDVGRRGQMQNLPDGPFGNGLPDDPLGGPEPDSAHLTGVVLRLNDDGSTPRDNPFYDAGREWGGSAGANLQKVFAYGLRNGFGMAFDPYSGQLWEAQNSDDAFSELNRITAGANLGWVQIMGPLSRVAEFKAIETSNDIDPVTGGKYFGLQQNRWPPTNIADTPDEALARMFQVVEGGKKFEATLTGAEEVPPVTTTARAELDLRLTNDGTLRYKLKATADINDMTVAHLHLGARGQNGQPVVFLAEFDAPRDFRRGQTIAEGEWTDGDLIPRAGFTDPVISELVARIRQGRIYVNVHTVAHPPGEIRGQVTVRGGDQVSHYSDPEFSWKYEVAPVGLGFLKGRALGREYDGDMFMGEARTFLENGYLFKFDMSRNRRDVRTSDPRLADDVADNKNKFDITESESLLFGRDFGITAEILTGPNGSLYVLSLSDGILREIHRPSTSGGGGGGGGGAAVFAGSLLPATADAPAPASVAGVTPRRAATEVASPSDERANRPEAEGVITIRSARPDWRTDVDGLTLDPVVVD